MSPVNFAWHVHKAQESWTGKVDAKAAILLALEGGALFTALPVHASGGVLCSVQGVWLVIERCSVGCLLLAIVCAALAVYPRLGRTAARQQPGSEKVIYFGDLRYWQPDDLSVQFEAMTEQDQLRSLSRQAVAMGHSNWRKHRAMQLSVILAVLAVAALVVVALV